MDWHQRLWQSGGKVMGIGTAHVRWRNMKSERGDEGFMAATDDQ
jgi:hypothetical protein